MATFNYKKDVIDLETARQMVSDRLACFNGHTYPVLADVRNIRAVSKEARDYFAGPEGVKGISALAILTGGFLTVVTANLFMRFSRPPIPTKVFKTKEQAVRWLNQVVTV